jgi:tRNA nucleotidyltransferase/poly(A) polymerase
VGRSPEHLFNVTTQREHTVDPERLAGVLDQPLFQAAERVAARMGVKAFAIGGYVRDLLLGRPCKDIDIVTEGDGIAYAEAVAKELGAGHVHVFKNFGTAMFMLR